MSTAEHISSLVNAGRWREARTVATEAADAADAPALQQLLARLAWLEGDAQGARAHLDAARAAAALPPDLEALRGRLMLTTDADAAEDVLRAAADGPTASVQGRLAWGDRLASNGRWGDALAIFKTVASDAESASQRASGALGLLGCSEALDDAESGEAGMQVLVHCWPTLPADDAQHAIATLVRLAPSRAQGLVDRLRDLPPARWHQMRAYMAWASGRHDDALRAAQAAVEADDSDDAARRLYAELLLIDDDVDAARPLIRALAARGTATPDLVLALFEATARNGRDRTTLDAVLSLARAHPHHPGVRVAAARALTDAGREPEARAMLVRAMDDDARLRTRLAPLENFFATSRAALPRLIVRTGIDERATVVRVRMGHNALMYQLRGEANDSFIKVSFPGARSRQHLEGTARLERALGALPSSLAVPCAVEVGGALTHAVADGWAVVTTGLRGQSLRRSLGNVRQSIQVPHAFEIGRALGELHGMLDTISDTPLAPGARQDPSTPQTPWGRPAADDGVRGGFSAAADWASGRRDWRELLDGLTTGLVEARLVEALTARMQPLFSRWRRVLPSLTAGVIHGDFGWHNLLWQAGKVVGVVDFDYAATDIRAADLANAIHRTAFDFNRLERGLSPRPRPEIAAAIVQGYRETGRPLPVPDFEALDAVARGVRCVYTLSLARADRASLTGAQYGRPARLLEALIRQLDWLERNDGLGAMLRRAGA